MPCLREHDWTVVVVRSCGENIIIILSIIVDMLFPFLVRSWRLLAGSEAPQDAPRTVRNF